MSSFWGMCHIKIELNEALFQRDWFLFGLNGNIIITLLFTSTLSGKILSSFAIQSFQTRYENWFFIKDEKAPLHDLAKWINATIVQIIKTSILIVIVFILAFQSVHDSALAKGIVHVLGILGPLLFFAGLL